MTKPFEQSPKEKLEFRISQNCKATLCDILELFEDTTNPNNRDSIKSKISTCFEFFLHVHTKEVELLELTYTEQDFIDFRASLHKSILEHPDLKLYFN